MSDENEILAEARAQAEAAARVAGDKTKNWPMNAIGFGFGAAIGSAAVAAAVLYAQRRDRKD